MPIATKNNAIIVKDGKLAESCACCGCPQDCACGCSCGSPLPAQVTITLSEIPDTLFADDGNTAVANYYYRPFNRSYTLCTSTSSTDLPPAYCDVSRTSYCRQLAGLCSRMIQYSWQGIDTSEYFSAVGNAGADSCAFAAAAFGSPTAGSSACLGEFAFAAKNLNAPLTLRGLYSKSVDGQGRAIYTPAAISGQCGDLSFDGYSQIWFAPGRSEMYFYNPTGLRKIDQATFNRSLPIGIYARVTISSSQSCSADRVVTGEPVFKTSNSFAVTGDGFSTVAFSKTVTATATLTDFNFGTMSYLLAGRPNCAPCSDGHTKQPPQVTSWTMYRRVRGHVSECTTAFSDPSPDVFENVAGTPIPATGSIWFVPNNRGSETNQWLWLFLVKAPGITFPAGMCGRANPSLPQCPESDLSFGPPFIGVSSFTPAGSIPQDFYWTQWISSSGGGASQVTQSVDGLEPAPTFSYRDVVYTMDLAYRVRITFA
jgi:hypothetical protein